MRRSELKRAGFGRRAGVRQPSLYSRTEETHERKNFGWLYTLIFCVILTSVLYLVFFSPYFKVRKVIFGDTKYVSRNELEGAVQSSRGLFNNNIFTFGFFNFRGRLGEVTGVRSYKIIRQWPGTVRIEIVEKSPIFVWQILDHKYLVDENGYVWANYEDKYASLPVVVDTKNVPVNVGDRIVPTGFVGFARDIFGSFEGTTGTKAVKYEILDIVSDLKVTSSDGWYVYFDTSRTAKNELTSLVRVLEEARNKKRKLEYIDLRIDSRIFYK